MSEQTIHTVAATNQPAIPVPYDSASDENLVKVTIEYPKNFDGQKFYKDGQEVFVSPQSAQQYVDAGIGSVDKDAKKAIAEANNDDSKPGVTSTASVTTSKAK